MEISDKARQELSKKYKKEAEAYVSRSKIELERNAITELIENGICPKCGKTGIKKSSILRSIFKGYDIYTCPYCKYETDFQLSLYTKDETYY